ncbi:MAG: transketolase [Candidatus Thermoplasmatota archaeon]|nr:transketolase [Candidatus Thermoplasmatota archaeon]
MDYLHDLDSTLPALKDTAQEARRWIIKMIHEAGSGHPGGSMSSVEILTALYFRVMKHDPNNPNWEDRDRLVLSKGHGAPALYSMLALSGYFDRKELMTLRKLGSRLQGHPSMNKTPGIDISTGSLGQGLSLAIGMALGGKLDRKDYRVYCILGDGEIQEGQVWEAAMAATHYKVDNLCAVLDRNKLQIDGPTEKIMSIEPVFPKFKAFGWHVIEVNGHDLKELLRAFKEAETYKGKPTIIIANTIKGKGVSFMEGSLKFHGKPPTKEELDQALEELGGDV